MSNPKASTIDWSAAILFDEVVEIDTLKPARTLDSIPVQIRDLCDRVYASKSQRAAIPFSNGVALEVFLREATEYVNLVKDEDGKRVMSLRKTRVEGDVLNLQVSNYVAREPKSEAASVADIQENNE